MTDPKTLTREQVKAVLAMIGRAADVPLRSELASALARTALAAMDRAARWEGEHADTTVSLRMATRRAEKAEADHE